VLAGHRRYANITTLRCDPVNPPLLGMAKVVSEDAVRRALTKTGWALHPLEKRRLVTAHVGSGHLE
jgi:hypothetical protein